MCLLKNDEPAHPALSSPGIDLSSAKTFPREDRDAFWTATVAPKWRDDSFSQELHPTGVAVIEDCFVYEQNWSGENLKAAYFHICSYFKLQYENWSLSGQDNPKISRNFANIEIPEDWCENTFLMFSFFNFGTAREEI